MFPLQESGNGGRPGAQGHPGDVPAGVAADNVAFVEAHHDEIAAVLKILAVEN